MPAIKAIFTSDTSSMERGFALMNARTKDFAARIGQASTAASVASTGGIYRPSAIARSGFRGFGVAGSMFTSVARDSAASLASGAPITQVIAQQAPQVLQALSMMRLGVVALQGSIIVAGAAITGYLVKKFADSYFEVERTLKVTERLASALKEMESRRSLMRLESLQSTQAASNDVKRARDIAENQSNAADAAAELAKERARAEALDKHRVLTKQQELELERKILDIESERARQKLKQAQQAQTGVEEAQAALAAAEKERADVFGQWTEGKRYGQGGFSLTAEEIAKREREALELNFKVDEAKKNLETARSKTNQGDIDKAEAEVIRLNNQRRVLGLSPVTSSWQSIPTTERERIGLGASSSINLSLLDANKRTAAATEAIREILRSGNTNGASVIF